MPTYEYECQDCGKSFEKFQLMNDAVLKECPSCKGLVKRLIGAGMGIIYRGNGFYTTDYKGKESGGEKNKTEGKTNGGAKGCIKEDKGKQEKKEGPKEKASSE